MSTVSAAYQRERQYAAEHCHEIKPLVLAKPTPAAEVDYEEEDWIEDEVKNQRWDSNQGSHFALDFNERKGTKRMSPFSHCRRPRK